MGGYAGTGGGYAGAAVRNGGRPPFDRNPTTWVPQAPMRSGKPIKINKTFAGSFLDIPKKTSRSEKLEPKKSPAKFKKK